MFMTANAGRSGVTSFARRPAARRIAAFAKLLLASAERSRQRRALAALSDHQLHDIGLTRTGFIHRATVFGCCDAMPDASSTVASRTSSCEFQNSTAV